MALQDAGLQLEAERPTELLEPSKRPGQPRERRAWGQPEEQQELAQVRIELALREQPPERRA